MKQIRQTLLKAYKSSPDSLDQTELRMIGRDKKPEPVKIDTSGLDRFLRVRDEAQQIINTPTPVPKPRRVFGGLNRDFTNQKLIEGDVLYGPKKD